MTYALSSEALTDEEAQELTRYLDWYREREEGKELSWSSVDPALLV